MIFLVSAVSAAKIIADQTNVNGYQIFYPEFDTFPQNMEVKLHLHLSNISNGYPIPNTDADCHLHLYYPNGSHSFEGQFGLDSNGEDWEIELSSGNFTTLGTHAFYIWCNNTASELGGEAKGIFTVTPTGYDFTIEDGLIYFMCILVLCGLFVVLLFVIEKLPSMDSRDEEGAILEISMFKHFRPILWIVEWLIILSIFFILSNIAMAYLFSLMIGNLLWVIFLIMAWSSVLILPLWLIWLFIRLFRDIEYKKMIERGVDPGSSL